MTSTRLDSTVPTTATTRTQGAGASSKPIQVRNTSNDSSQQMIDSGPDAFRIIGRASGRAAEAQRGSPRPVETGAASRIELAFEQFEVSVPVKAGATPAETAEALAVALPKGYRASIRATSDGVEVRLSKQVEAGDASKVPQVKLKLANTGAQRVDWTGDNRLTFTGSVTSPGGALPNALTLEIDGRGIRVPVEPRDNAATTASRLARALPAGYSATQAQGPTPGSVTVTIERAADGA